MRKEIIGLLLTALLTAIGWLIAPIISDDPVVRLLLSVPLVMLAVPLLIWAFSKDLKMTWAGNGLMIVGLLVYVVGAYLFAHQKADASILKPAQAAVPNSVDIGRGGQGGAASAIGAGSTAVGGKGGEGGLGGAGGAGGGAFAQGENAKAQGGDGGNAGKARGDGGDGGNAYIPPEIRRFLPPDAGQGGKGGKGASGNQ